MLLHGKNAIIYGGYGQVGRAVAHGLAAEGAVIHLTGRSREKLDDAAAGIRDAGGTVHTAVVDAMNEEQVTLHADAVAESAGSIDVSFNAISLGDVHGTPLLAMPLDTFERPVLTSARTMFLTTRAAARHMVGQGSGVLLFFGGDDGHDPMRDYYIGGFQVAIGLVDTLRRQLAAELGPYGIRAVTLQTGGIIETMPDGDDELQEIASMIVGKTMLKRAVSFRDVGEVAAFVCSDKARSITAASINITAGAVAD